jgi:DNA-binding transcriptional regulator LsrR (DeoR family)
MVNVAELERPNDGPRAKRRNRRWLRRRKLNDAQLLELCILFAEKKMKIRDIQAHFKITHGIQLSREDVHRFFREGIERGLARISASSNEGLEREIANAYGKDLASIHVADVPFRERYRKTALHAAELALSLIRKIGREKGRVGIGLGSGETVREVAQELAVLLRRAHDLPPLSFHVLSPGFDVKNPNTAAVTFLSYFEGIQTDVEFVGLFAPAVVRTGDYQHVKATRGVAESFDEAKGIDIVLTSLATAKDPHGALRQFARFGRRAGFIVKRLEDAGWKGDVQYCAFSDSGPLHVDAGVRSVTLFDIKDLKRLSQEENKHVIVVVRPCTSCGELKTEAVLPLLRTEKLHFWNHLVMDVATGQTLRSASMATAA